MANEVEDAFMNGVVAGMEKTALEDVFLEGVVEGMDKTAATTADRIKMLAAIKNKFKKGSAGYKKAMSAAAKGNVAELTKKPLSYRSARKANAAGFAQAAQAAPAAAAKGSMLSGLRERLRYARNRFGAMSTGRKAAYGVGAAALGAGAAYGGYKLYKKMKARKAMREQAEG